MKASHQHSHSSKSSDTNGAAKGDPKSSPKNGTNSAPKNALETIPFELRAGALRVDKDLLIFETADKNARAIFPSHAGPYVQRLMQGCDLEQLIIEAQSKGQTVDYTLLKTIVVTFFQAGCLKNSAAFRPFLEAWNRPPLQEPRLTEPLWQTRPGEIESDQGIGVFVAAAITCLFGLILIFDTKTLGLPTAARFWLSLLLFPSTLLSVTALLQIVYAVSIGWTTNLKIGARFTPLGAFFEADAGIYRKQALEPIVIHLACTLFLPGVAWMILEGKSPSLVARGFGETFALSITTLLTALCLLPGLRSPLATTRDQLLRARHFSGRPPQDNIASILLGLAVVGVCAMLGFGLLTCLSIISLMLNFSSHASNGALPVLILEGVWIIWAVLFLTDIFSVSSDLAEDFVQSRASQTAARLPSWFIQFRKFIAEGSDLFAGKSKSKNDHARIDNAFSENALFKMLNPDLRRELRAHARLFRVARGSRLIKQGADSTELFLLVSGSAGVYRHSSDRANSDGLLIRLGAGSIFGENGFFLNERRTADVIALETSEIIVIKRPAQLGRIEVEAAFVQDVFRKKIWASQALAGSDLFRHLPAEATLHILNFSDVVTVSPGTVIMAEGEGSDALWICVQGQAAVHVKGASRPDVSAGNVVGEIGLIWNAPRTATVTARTECIFLKLSTPAFRRLLSRDLRLASSLQELGAQRLENDRTAA